MNMQEKITPGVFDKENFVITLYNGFINYFPDDTPTKEEHQILSTNLDLFCDENKIECLFAIRMSDKSWNFDSKPKLNEDQKNRFGDIIQHKKLRIHSIVRMKP